MRSIVTLLLFLCSTSLFSQTIHSVTRKWNKGSVRLTNGEFVSGEISFEETLGHLQFRNGAAYQLLTPKKVSNFDFTEEDNGALRQRYFVCAFFKDPEHNLTVPTFFEVLKELKDFGFLKKTKMISSNSIHMPNPYSPTGANPSKKTRNEEFYLVTAENNFLLYMTVNSKHKHPDVQEEVLEKVMGAHLTRVKDFAKTNDLKFNQKEDFIKILDYYELLAQARN
jgi:hypothetical protein